MVLYAAFGSNTEPDHFRGRCPSARPVGAGLVPRHRLAFAGWSALWGGGVATLRSDPESSAPVFVYELTAAELFDLDRHEGHPAHYRRIRLPVQLEGDAAPVEAWAYLLPASTPRAPPSPEYLATIESGYAVRGLDRAGLLAAAGESVTGPDPVAGGHVLMVYGSLLRGLGNHRVLTRHSAAFLGRARTAEAAFTMWSLGGFPAVSRGGEDRIVGELYAVGPAALADLDELEGHPVWYRREPVAVQVPGDPAARSAHIYLMRPPGGPRVPDGDWRAFIGRRA